MGMISGLVKYKAIKKGLELVVNYFRKKKTPARRSGSYRKKATT